MSLALVGVALKADVPSAVARAILMKLADCCDEDGKRIFPSFATLAAVGKCSRKTAKRYIQLFCAVGLLTKVRAGGFGPGSTNYYDLNVSVMLALVDKPWVEIAGSMAVDAPEDSCPDDDSEAGTADFESAECAESRPETGASYAGKKRVMMTPLEIRGTPETPLIEIRGSNDHDKGVTGDPQPLNRTLKHEREGARARGEENPLEPEAVSHAAGEGLGEGERTWGRATLADFKKAWPAVAIDDQDRIEAAWNALPFDQRRAAIDGVKPFLDALKAGGRKHPPASWNYLAQRRWLLIEAETAPKKLEPVFVKPWSDDWWAVLLRKCAAGQRAGLMVEWAQAGKGITLLPGDAPGRGEVEALKPYLCEGPELEAWRPWFRARGAELPRLRGNFRVFLPGAAPPGAVVEQGDL